MAEFTLDDLKRALDADDEAAELTDGELDTSFDDLGYDSLALLELAGRVQRDHGTSMPDDAPDHMRTPRAALEFINARLTKTVDSGV
ncbi:acyl carrier protein [Saccharopolyspora indica]|uniref:acyl carrier protein n=1 Tax=Saccharopolyspora indica TaxID=1229659 RepID=UPI0022EAF737|nr:acyl carrier protein [Saccharopolyspora indica]MDA3647668.1 acyl carrier protein [Saccharopolyspora indica]